VKLHDLKPAPGSRKARRRVGRGIAAGQGKTAGRGTKGQKARAGGTIPAWFEGGQTPLHQRIPKLRGFRNLFKVEYEVVNIGDIARIAESGGLDSGETPDAKSSKKGAAPITVNQEILRGVGLVRRLDRPMKVLGGGELSTALFVVADAFSASARTKIEAAGGTVSILETPDTKRPAIGVDTGTDTETPAETPVEEVSAETPAPEATAVPAAARESIEAAAEEVPVEAPKRSRATKAKQPAAKADASAEEAPGDEVSPPKARAPRKPRATKPAADA
jgi:large subunit ribosomal protein L15